MSFQTKLTNRLTDYQIYIAMYLSFITIMDRYSNKYLATSCKSLTLDWAISFYGKKYFIPKYLIIFLDKLGNCIINF